MRYLIVLVELSCAVERSPAQVVVVALVESVVASAFVAGVIVVSIFRFGDALRRALPLVEMTSSQYLYSPPAVVAGLEWWST